MNRSEIFINTISHTDPVTKEVTVWLGYNLHLRLPFVVRTDQYLHNRSEVEYRGLRHPALQGPANKFEKFIEKVERAAEKIAMEMNKG